MSSRSYKKALEERELSKQIDMKTKEYNEGFIRGQEHRTSSPETKKLVDDLSQTMRLNIKDLVKRGDCDKNLNNMADKLDKISDKLEDMMIKLAEMPQAILDKGDERYAPKWTSGAVKFVMAVVFSAVIGAVVGLVLK